MTEFIENTNVEEAEKQDCERNTYYRLMGRLKKESASVSERTAFMRVK